MKTKQIWANLTVKDTKITTEFYTRLGVKPNMPQSTPELTSFLFWRRQFCDSFF